uniref:E2F1/2/3/6 transcription factor n=1 Tax=Phallusia mammillata TaxID=59560 RepID=A0A6F9DC61_9ASCI|nr:E2F1/2/3/6 transcription factor [Phallusia mammillata]
MTSASKRVFSATTARETLSNNLASISPGLADTSFIPAELNFSPSETEGMQWLTGHHEIVGLADITTSNAMKTQVQQAKRKLELDPTYNPNRVQENSLSSYMQLNNVQAFKSPLKSHGKNSMEHQMVAPNSMSKKRSRQSSISGVQKSPGEKSRYDTSLGLLTKRFINLMHTSDDGVLDLNWAAEVLHVQKRRIYDITNVLEGIKLIEKRSKNNVQWLAAKTSSNSREIDRETKASRLEMQMLKEQEEELDSLIRQRQIELERLSESNSKFSYVTYQDLRSIKSFKDQIVICIKAPQDTKLEVPDPGEKIQMLLKSTKGEIDVFLCPDPEDLMSPTKSSASFSAGEDSCSSDSNFDSSLSQEKHPKATSPVGECSGYSSALMEDQEICPSLEASRPLLLQTEDQLGSSNDTEVDSAFIDEDSVSFIPLSPSMNPEDYLFSLDDSEGISELFDMHATSLTDSGICKNPM